MPSSTKLCQSKWEKSIPFMDFCRCSPCFLRYFASSRYPSFKRQLSWYKFVRITIGPDKGSYYHEFFLRGRPDLTERIRRNRNQSKNSSALESNAKLLPPDFYKFPFCIKLLDQDVALLSGRGVESGAQLGRGDSEKRNHAHGSRIHVDFATSEFSSSEQSAAVRMEQQSSMEARRNRNQVRHGRSQRERLSSSVNTSTEEPLDFRYDWTKPVTLLSQYPDLQESTNRLLQATFSPSKGRSLP